MSGVKLRRKEESEENPSHERICQSTPTERERAAARRGEVRRDNQPTLANLATDYSSLSLFLIFSHAWLCRRTESIEMPALLAAHKGPIVATVRFRCRNNHTAQRMPSVHPFQNEQHMFGAW